MKRYRIKPSKSVKAIQFTDMYVMKEVLDFAVFPEAMYAGNTRIVQGDWVILDEGGRTQAVLSNSKFTEMYEEVLE